MRKTIASLVLFAAMASSGPALAQSSHEPELPSGIQCLARDLAPHYIWDFARMSKDGPALFYGKLQSMGVECKEGPTTHRLLGMPSFTRRNVRELVAALLLARGFSDLNVSHTDAAALIEYYGKEVAAANAKANAAVAAKPQAK